MDNSDLSGLMAVGALLLMAIFDDGPKLEFIQAVRADELRTQIQNGKRFRLDQMQDILQLHQEKGSDGEWRYINVDRIAEIVDLDLNVVRKAVKRFWFF